MKILIVEDDIFFQKFYSNKLALAGFEMQVASDGNEGLEKMTSWKPDLVLLDLIMPNKDGFDVLESVSQNPELKKTPIIIFSTLGDQDDIKKAMQLGAVDYINKSFHDIENLKAKIIAHLPGYAAAPQPVAAAAIAQPPAPVASQAPIQPKPPIVSPPPPNGNPPGTA